MTRAESGCTLIEAMVALAVLATGILFFVQSSHLSLRSSAAGRRDERALAMATEWIEVLRDRPWEEAVRGCGRRSDPGEMPATALCTVIRGSHTYRLDLTRSRAHPLVDRLTVRCGVEGGGRMRQVVLETAVERRP